MDTMSTILPSNSGKLLKRRQGQAEMQQRQRLSSLLQPNNTVLAWLIAIDVNITLKPVVKDEQHFSLSCWCISASQRLLLYGGLSLAVNKLACALE